MTSIQARGVHELGAGQAYPAHPDRGGGAMIDMTTLTNEHFGESCASCGTARVPDLPTGRLCWACATGTRLELTIDPDGTREAQA